MKKLFVLSDIHGFSKELKEALRNVGFNVDEPDHYLLVLGDVLDRGRDPEGVIAFLMEILSKGRLLLVRGNHEQLFVQMCQRRYALGHDIHNGTLQTVLDLSGLSTSLELTAAHFAYAYSKMRPLLLVAKNYVETSRYIFVHSWLPLIEDEKGEVKLDPNWRMADSQAFAKAAWVSPLEMIDKKLFPADGKTLVFGHWGTHFFHERDGIKDHNIYYGDRYVALDACTVVSKQINVLIVDDEILEEA